MIAAVIIIACLWVAADAAVYGPIARALTTPEENDVRRCD